MNSKVLNVIKNMISTISIFVGLVVVLQGIHGIALLGVENHILRLLEELKCIITGVSGIFIGNFVKYRIVIK